jgi:hypothetical protein
MTFLSIVIIRVAGRQMGLLSNRVIDMVSRDAGRCSRCRHVTSERVGLLAGLLTLGSGPTALTGLSHLLAERTAADQHVVPDRVAAAQRRATAGPSQPT